MSPDPRHLQPRSVEEAEQVQEELSRYVDLASHLQVAPSVVAGVDVTYDQASPAAAAAAVLIDLDTLEVRESAVAHGEVRFPYVPGLLAFREVPILLEALGKLRGRPDVVVCDGYGIAHPRKFGLACHVGVLTGLPTFGVAKTPFTTAYDEPGPGRGDRAPLREAGAVLGAVLRTQTNVKPVFVSVGHRMSLDEAISLTLELSGRFRIPEAIRKADSVS